MQDNGSRDRDPSRVEVKDNLSATGGGSTQDLSGGQDEFVELKTPEGCARCRFPNPTCGWKSDTSSKFQAPSSGLHMGARGSREISRARNGWMFNVRPALPMSAEKREMCGIIPEGARCGEGGEGARCTLQKAPEGADAAKGSSKGGGASSSAAP